MGFLTLIVLMASSRLCRESRLSQRQLKSNKSDCGVVGAHHSLGGMTLTIPDFMPYLSILSMYFLKLRNWSMVCNTSQPQIKLKAAGAPTTRNDRRH